MYIDNKYYRLSTILYRVKDIVDKAISNNYFWLRAEIGQLKEDRKGHLYLELVEHKDGVVLAKCRANIWQSNAYVIKKTLGENANEILKNGAEIMCYCEVTFSNLYGMSINIHQIDLSYSLGEVERIKQENLRKLVEQGYHQKNKELYLPAVLQRIALVSSKGTAGHADFIKQLEENEYNFVYHLDHYDCQVQGDGAVASIQEALSEIEADMYDVIVLIRGGGSALDLDVFNHYELAVTLATSHTPVFTGIGHETDSSLADFVANRYFKTPSAVAAYIVERTALFYTDISRMYEGIMQSYKQHITVEQHKLEVAEKEIRLYGVAQAKQKKQELGTLSNRLITEVRKRLHTEESFIESATQSISYRAQRITGKENQTLKEKTKLVAYLAQQCIDVHQQQLNTSLEKLVYQAKGQLKKERVRLVTFEEITTAYDLSSILRKGFAIVMHNGQLLNEHKELNIGDELEIAIYNKKYRIILAEIKEVKQWNNLLMKKPL
ncbi:MULTISPECIES: exodeoxyribonuclease VII large subunit [Myroides]|uniref:exodeoxyribonuclease VII large subunit n=1 Tax=Myroides TaxID=76831 RepID=UPI00024616B2|nr:MULTISPECIES: exodeoxyribonuclease VII large subunit [Myroides]EHO15256.1 hypothetical protein HMPREF9714_00013 [Myroides odoratimimus CCUG 12901]MCO7724310.1 exodeoxyribonuclease VII large subunit [Myroides odoratimimus]MCS7472700.1 exodeoxyribonuclease VII large subunit [Myroides odoratimimus]MDM1038958.1 exodeoxyribonuclease VII large subunit [Myroides odoratimimus]MDM1053145.1 exodeoxyribonuclease VII large subunit [Myroides odoratimimus]